MGKRIEVISPRIPRDTLDRAESCADESAKAEMSAARRLLSGYSSPYRPPEVLLKSASLDSLTRGNSEDGLAHACSKTCEERTGAGELPL